jgi:molybdate transport system ATP-binding protein
VVLHRGKTLMAAPPREVMQRPPTSEVARLVGLTNLFKAQLLEHDEDAGISRIKWLDSILECDMNLDFSVGETLEWLIPANKILLHQRVRPSNGERENPLHGTIVEALTLGDFTQIEFRPNASETESLTFRVPIHVIERNNLTSGDPIGVSLRTTGIHLMKSVG